MSCFLRKLSGVTLLAIPCLSAQTVPVAPLSHALASSQGGAPGYVLGVNDEIVVQALHVPEMDGKPVRLDAAGGISLPLIGRVQAAGLTADELQSRICERLDPFIQDPQVRIEIVAFRSQPVSVMGAVRSAGVFYLQGPAALATVLSLAGGLAPDAAEVVQVRREKRCRSPLPGARADGEGWLIAAIRVSQLVTGGPEDVLVCAGDVISVPRARLVYVVGEVRKPGGFMLRDEESMSVLQALALAEGPVRTAATRHARVLRTVPGQPARSEEEVDLTKVLSGKHPDIPLAADDILFVPNSAPKSAATRVMETALQMCVGVVIWGR